MSSLPRAEAQAVTLRAGQFLTLSAGIPHVVEAAEESAFLLTMGAETQPWLSALQQPGTPNQHCACRGL